MEINEPVAWISKYGVVYPFDAKDEVNPINELQPLFTSPLKREWVGFTDEEWKDIEDTPGRFYQGVVWAQAKLKEKNT